MPENPPLQPVGELKPVGKTSSTGIKPVGELKPIGKVPSNKIIDFSEDPTKTNTTIDIINSLPEMPGDTESKKEILRDLVNNGASADEVNNSILTLQGKHPHQEGGLKYYTNDKGVAIPLKNSETPPPGYHVASLFGTPKDAKDDGAIMDLAKTAWNIFPSAAENVVDVLQTGYQALTDDSSDNLNSLKNAANYLKFEKDPDIGGSLYNTEGIKSAVDLLDTKRFDLSAKTVWGNALSLGQSIGEMLIPASAAGKLTKGASWATKTVDGVTKLTTAGKAATIGAASFLVNHGEVKDAAEAAGLKGRDLAAFATLVTIPIAAVDTKLGLDSKIFENASIKAEKDAFIKTAAQKVMAKTVEGNLSKEALDEAIKETMITYPQIAKSWAKQVGKDAFEQGAEESAQQFLQNSGEQVYDNLSNNEKATFGTEAFSPESFGEYFQNFLAGSIGGGPAALAFHATKKKEQEVQKNSTVYGVVQQGDEAVKNFKRNVYREQKEGGLTPEEAQDAITRVNSFKDYDDIIGALDLKDEQKREAFDLSFQKQNLETKLRNMGDKTKIENPLEQAKYAGIEKQAADLQKKINEIILAAQVKDETKVADKTVNDVSKAAEKSKEESKHPETFNKIRDQFKKIAEKDENRTYEEIPVAEYNSNKLNARVKQAKTVDYLEKQPNSTLVGTLTERKWEHGNKKDKVIGVKLPDGKIIRLSSSMKRDEGFRGHFREEQLKTLKNDQFEGLPIAVKVETIPADKEGEQSKKAIKAYNTKTGKFVGWIKATNTGGNTKVEKVPEFSSKQIEHLQELEMVVEPPIDGTTVEKTPTEPINPVKPNINESNSPKLEELTRTLNKDGKKGISIENGKKQNYGPPTDEIMPDVEGYKFVVSRNEKGGINGVIEVSYFSDDTGELTDSPQNLKIVVDKKERRKGIATQMFNYAEKNGLNLESIRGKYTTQDGANLYNYRIKNNAQPSAEQFVSNKINALKADESAQFDQDLENNGTYQRYFEKQYEKQFGETNSTALPEQTQPETGETGQSVEQNIQTSETKRLYTGTKKSNRKIKSKLLLNALKIEVNNPYDYILQYFIGGGKVNYKSVEKLFKSPKEALSRVNYVYNGAGDMESVAHNLWEQFMDETGNRRYDDTEFANEMEEVVSKFTTPSEMATYLTNKYNPEATFTPMEEVVNNAVSKAEQEGVGEQINEAIEELEQLSDSALEELEKDDNKIQDFTQDIITGEDQNPLFSISNKRNKSTYNTIKNQDFVDKMFDLSEKSNREVLEFVKSRLEDNELIKIVDHLILNSHKLKTIFKGFKGYVPEKIAGTFDPSDNTIRISTADISNDLALTILHEYMHAFSYNALHKPISENEKQFKKEITDIFNTLKKDTQYSNEYGFTNVDEFISEIMSKSDFVQKLKSDSKTKSLFDRIIDAIKALFGISSKESELVDEAINKILNFTDQYQYRHTSNVNNIPLHSKANANTFDKYREEKLGRNIAEIKEHLDYIKERLEDDDLSDSEEDDLLLVKRGYNEQYKEDRATYNEFAKGTERLEKLDETPDLEGETLDNLIEDYNLARNADGYADKALLDRVKLRIAKYISETRRQELRKHDKFIEASANKRDLSWKDIWFKTLSHMTQDFPELQELSNMFDESFLDMQMERNEKKKKLKTLADAVIKEKNKALGILGKAQNLFSSNNAKYFEYMDKDGKFITDTSGLSEAQKNLLNYMKSLVKDRKLQDEDGNLIEDEIIKLDKGFQETYKDEGLLQAFGNYFGGTSADAEVTYINPLTEKQETASYSEAESNIIKAAKTPVQKTLALTKLLKLAYRAKRNDRSNSSINYNGQLTSKFDKPREKTTGYSNDFYNAALQYIDDVTHVKYLGKFVPIVDSIEYLSANGYGDQLSKPNVVKWLKEWKEEQLYKKPKESDPIIDSSLKFLRTLTSQIVMGFNITASIMNVFIGNYNNWRKDAADLGWLGFKSGWVGNKRFASKKGLALIDKYQVVNTDLDSFPRFNVLKTFENIAYAAQKYGEMQIQGTMFLSQLTEEEWNSFEMKDGELQLKPGVDGKKIKKKFVEYKNKISDVQGKYSEKDRRNFMRGELGKIVSQFKVWMPDAWKERFGKEYIDSHGHTVKGSWRSLNSESFNAISKQFMENGVKAGFKEISNNKELMANLKGAMLIALILVAKYQDDDDKKKRRKALSLNNALGNLLFVFDTDQLKYLAKSPVASLGTVQKFIETFQDVQNLDDEKFLKDLPKVLPYGKAITETANLLEED